MKNPKTNQKTGPLYTHSRVWQWTKKVLTGLIGLLFVLAVTGAIFQYVTTRINERRYPPPGELIDIGGYRLHLNCSGVGSPAVIMDAGFGSTSLDWTLVQPKIAEFTRVCSYDRAGLGWSDRGSFPRTSQTAVKELHILLTTAGIKGPYILVGHSLGGMNMLLYAATYSDDVAGLVLVDSAHEDGFKRFSKFKEPIQMKVLNSPLIFKSLTIFGMTRLYRWWEQPHLKLQPDIQAKVSAVHTRTQHLLTLCDENLSLEKSYSQLDAAPKTLGDKPLAVIAHGKAPAVTGMSDEQKNQVMEAERIWRELQEDLAVRSSRGKLIIAAESGHYIEIDQPELVIEAVRSVIHETPNKSIRRSQLIQRR